MATRKTGDAISLLKSDHRKVEDLFAKGSEDPRLGRKAGAGYADLHRVHYSRHGRGGDLLSSTGQAKDDVIDEAYVEHDGAKVLISELINSDPSNEF